MSKTVTVTVLREHSGDAGHHKQNSTYSTTLQHARELRGQGLVAFDESNTGKGAKAVKTQTNETAPKAQPKPRNKAEPAPLNKVEKGARNKASAS